MLELSKELLKAVEAVEKAKVDIPDSKVSTDFENERKEFVKFMHGLVEKLNAAVTADVSSVISYYNTCSEAWTKANTASARAYKLLKEFVPQSKEAVNVFSKVYKELETFGEVLKPLQESLEKAKLINKAIEDLDWLEKKLKEKEEEKALLLKTIKEKKEKLAEAEKKLAEFETSHEVMQVKELTKQRNALEYREKEIASDVIELLSPLSRSFRKALPLLEKEERKLLEAYLNSPFDALLGDKDLQINALLKKLKSLLADGKISVKNEEAAAKQINALLSSRLLENYRQVYFENEEKIKSIDEKISELDVKGKRESLESEISSLKADIEDAEKSLKKAEEKMEELSSLMETVKADLEEKLSSFLRKKAKILFVST